MTPEEAGAALACDPSFLLMAHEEREDEAARLLGGFSTPSDDPLDIARTIECAIHLQAIGQDNGARRAGAEIAPGIEPCRLNGAGGPPCTGREPVAGNGRCMTCGAMRHARTPPEPAPPPAPAKVPKRAPKKRGTAPATALRHGVTYDPGASYLGRFKEVTGATDREVADMLGVSRPTVQAYVGGRLPEKLDGVGVGVLMADLAERLVLLADLRRELAAVIGAVD
jgi:hypothetical protein